jgi:hypothetical protein
MEYKYKIMDPKQLTQDSEYGIYGPIALLAVIQQTYGRLIATNDWPALSINLPESNIAFKSPTSTKLSNTTIQCFRCGENHHIRNCPQPDKRRNATSTYQTGSNSKGLAPWKYIEPKNLSSTITDQHGKVWKFCTKCMCRYTKKVGIYQLSHYDNEHDDTKIRTYLNVESPATKRHNDDYHEGNLASAKDTTKSPEYLGAWNASYFIDFSLPDCTLSSFSINFINQDQQGYTSTATPNRHPVIIDSGASLAITPFYNDFIEPLTLPPGNLILGGMANGLKIEGTGLVKWWFQNTKGIDVPIYSYAYYVPKAPAWLLSPQRLFDQSNYTKGNFTGTSKGIHLHIENDHFVFKYDPRSFLPIGYAAISSPTYIQTNLSIHHEENQNLTSVQKLLLHWHDRFGHLNLPAVQRILRAPPFIIAKFREASKCSIQTLRCSICQYAKHHRKALPSTTVSTHTLPDLNAITGSLKRNHLRPGAKISVDHFESRILGRTFDSFEKLSSEMFKGGCIFIDHASGFVHIEHQIGFSAIETIRAKQSFEQLALSFGVVVESYLTDSGTFKASLFVQHLRNHNQSIHFCGANAHHKNGIAERGVRSISNMARAMLLHASTLWKSGIDASLWPMAVKYTSYLYNLPNLFGICPCDVFTGTTIPRYRLSSIHVWGCPIYVLDPKLQAGEKLPRWQPRS